MTEIFPEGLLGFLSFPGNPCDDMDVLTIDRSCIFDGLVDNIPGIGFPSRDGSKVPVFSARNAATGIQPEHLQAGFLKNFTDFFGRIVVGFMEFHCFETRFSRGKNRFWKREFFPQISKIGRKPRHSLFTK